MEALYRDQILDHYRHPRNYGPVDDLPATAEADNPLCGDRILMGLRLVGGRIEEVRFHGRGCAVCMAAASLLTEHLPGLDADTVTALEQAARDALVADAGTPLPSPLEGLSALRDHPARHRCLLLPLEALLAALPPE